MDTLSSKIRRTLLAVAENESLFLWLAFLDEVMLSFGPLKGYMEQVKLFRSFVILPWGMALCALRLSRREREIPARPAGTDVRLLFALLLWMVVPFGLRFGLSPYHLTMMQGTAIVYFGLYAGASEERAQKRGQLMDLAGALFAALSLVLGGALLYCVVTGRSFYPELNDQMFGVNARGFLHGGMYYNATGILANCCLFMSLIGFARRKHRAAKLAHLIPAAMMAVVVVLTQSRTSRYAMLAALAAGAYGAIACSGKLRSAVQRQAVALAAAAAVLVGGYVAADELTTAALRHYDEPVQIVAAAKAEDAEAAAQAEKPEYEGRGIGDMSFTGRTEIWKRLMNDWKANPKYFLIGRGIGNVPEGLLQINTLTAHNAYLQIILDYGLIGFALLAAFFVSVLRPVLRVFFVPAGAAKPGDRALCMMVICALVTGLMESFPLMVMTTGNMTLFFCLGLLVSRGREIMKNAE